MFDYLKKKYKKAEIELPLSISIVNILEKNCKSKFECALPKDFKQFLSEMNGFYCNGYSIFGCYNENAMKQDKGIAGLDFMSFNERFREYSEIEDYLILGKSSIEYIVYELATNQYMLITNGTLEELYRCDTLELLLNKYLEDL